MNGHRNECHARESGDPRFQMYPRLRDSAKWFAVFAGMAMASVTLPAHAQSQKIPSFTIIQNQDRTFRPGADYDTIIERGWIDFGAYEDFPPYASMVDGEPQGIDIDLAHLIAEEIGVEARIHLLPAGESVDADLRFHVWKGPIVGDRVMNVMMHVPYNRELDIRNEQVLLTGQYMNESTAIAYSTTHYEEDEKPVPAYFRFDKVGVENDSLADFYLSSIGNGSMVNNIRRYPTPAAAMAALQAGEIPAVMGSLAQLEHGAGEGIAVHQPPLPGLALGNWTLGVGIRHNYRQLGYAVDDAIRAAIEDGRMKAIFEKYGATFQPPDR